MQEHLQVSLFLGDQRNGLPTIPSAPATPTFPDQAVSSPTDLTEQLTTMTEQLVLKGSLEGHVSRRSCLSFSDDAPTIFDPNVPRPPFAFFRDARVSIAMRCDSITDFGTPRDEREGLTRAAWVDDVY